MAHKPGLVALLRATKVSHLFSFYNQVLFLCFILLRWTVPFTPSWPTPVQEGRILAPSRHAPYPSRHADIIRQGHQTSHFSQYLLFLCSYTYFRGLGGKAGLSLSL